ncbi:type IV secretion system protein [Neisseriaceae bacterium ESL0693]|nr:type IV secretion system protein [Neisseriaceae bacterium ESL0693]
MFRTKCKKVTAVVLSAFIMISPVAMATGIPTFDGAAAANALQSLIQMKTQIDNQISQINELKSQVKALSGSRNLGKILNSVKDQVPAEWQAIYGNGAIATDYKDLIKPKTYSNEEAAKALFANYDMTLKSFEDTKKRLDNIQALMNKINTTQDIKAAADLQSRISAEQAIIANNQTKLDMMAKMFDIQEKIIEQQQIQKDRCFIAAKYGRSLSGC